MTDDLFIGLLPDDPVRDALVAHQAAWYFGPRSRPTRRIKLHLTLYFLGKLDTDARARVREVLAAETVAPFDLVLRNAERWSNHVAVLRPDPHPALDDLRTRLAHHLGRAGFSVRDEGDWNPHVTLARDAPNAAPPEAPRPIVWTVRDVALLLSRPAAYETLGRYGAD